MTSDDWDRLYDAVVTGNLAVIDGIMPKLHEFLLRVAHHRLQGRPGMAESAEDCVQETLIAIWKATQKGQACRERRAMCSWCIRIVIHKVLNYLRKHPQVKIAIDDLSGKGEDLIIVGSGDSDLLGTVMRNELIVKIFTNTRLTDREKSILWASFMEEQDDIIIAGYWKISRTTVRVIRMRALRKLRQDGILDDYQ